MNMSRRLMALATGLAIGLFSSGAWASHVPVWGIFNAVSGADGPVLIKGTPVDLGLTYVDPGAPARALQADFSTEGLKVDSILPGKDLPVGYTVEWSHIGSEKLRIGLLASGDKSAAPLPTGELVVGKLSPLPDATSAKFAPLYSEVVDSVGRVLVSGDFFLVDGGKRPISGDFQVVDSLVYVEGGVVSFDSEVQVGKSADKAITLINRLQEPVSVDLSVAEPFSFPVGSIGVPGGGSAEVRAVFAPSRPGRYSQAVSVQSGSATLGGFRLEAKAKAAPQAQLALSPSFVDFGTVLVGKPSSRKLALSNVGDGDFSGSVSVAGDGFALSGDRSLSVKAGESKEIEVVLTAGKDGSVDGRLEVKAAVAGGSRNSVRAGLSGYGLARKAAETVIPQNIFVTSPDVQSASVALSNIGDVDLTVKLSRHWAPYGRPFFDWTFQGVSNDESFVGALSADKSDSVKIDLNDYISSIRNHVARNSLLVVLGNEAEKYQRSYTVMIRGLEDAAVPAFLPMGRSLAYGNVLVGTSSTKAILLSNEGKKDMSYQVSLSGSGFAMAVPGDSTGTIAGGDSKALQVAFTPVSADSVTGKAKVVVTEVGSANRWTRGYDLSGTGTTLSKVVCGYPSSVVIPPVPMGTEVPPSATFSIVNRGSADGLVVSGDVSPDLFVLDGALSGVSLNAGEERTFSVRLKDVDKAGIFEGAITLTTNDDERPSVSIPLTAELLDVNSDGVPSDKVDPSAHAGISADKVAGVKDGGNALGIGVNSDLVSRDIKLAAPLNFDDAVKRMTVSADWGDNTLALPSGLWNVTVDCAAGEVVVLEAKVNDMPADASWWKLTWNPDDYSSSFEAMTEISLDVDLASSDEAIFAKNQALFPDPGHPGGGYFVRTGANSVKLYIVEGGIYDADRLRNGRLVDPGGAGKLEPKSTPDPERKPVAELFVVGGTLLPPGAGSISESDIKAFFVDAGDKLEVLGSKKVSVAISEDVTSVSLDVTFKDMDDGTDTFTVFAKNRSTGKVASLKLVQSSSSVKTASGIETASVEGKMTVTLTDNSDYDQDEATGTVVYELGFAGSKGVLPVDPGDNPGGSSSSGCSVGFSGWGLLLLLPLLFLKKGRFSAMVLVGALALTGSAWAAEVSLKAPSVWEPEVDYDLPISVSVGEGEELTSFTADLDFRSDRVKAFASGVQLSSAMYGKGWNVRVSQFDLPGNVRRVRILMYGDSPLESGEIATIKASALSSSSLASRSIGFVSDSPKAGDDDGNVVKVDSGTSQGEVSQSSGSGGGCSLGLLAPASLLLLAPMVVLFSRR